MLAESYAQHFLEMENLKYRNNEEKFIFFLTMQKDPVSSNGLRFHKTHCTA
jgi:hypothetical protein